MRVQPSAKLFVFPLAILLGAGSGLAQGEYRKGLSHFKQGQYGEAIDEFERTAGVVATIKSGEGSKSAQLAEALSGDKKIVVCTIQTFPFALEAVRELAATEGKKFAVIADEAHSSQTGEAASKLKQVLTAEEQQELADGGTISSEDILAAEMAARAKDEGITYVAFTATPKAKTLELFGRRPDPEKIGACRSSRYTALRRR